MDCFKLLGMDYFIDVDILIQLFHQYLHSYHCILLFVIYDKSVYVHTTTMVVGDYVYFKFISFCKSNL